VLSCRMDPDKRPGPGHDQAHVRRRARVYIRRQAQTDAETGARDDARARYPCPLRMRPASTGRPARAAAAHCARTRTGQPVPTGSAWSLRPLAALRGRRGGARAPARRHRGRDRLEARRAACGVSTGAMSKLLYGSRGRPPSRRIRRDGAEDLAIRRRLSFQRGCADGCHRTRRRVQGPRRGRLLTSDPRGGSGSSGRTSAGDLRSGNGRHGPRRRELYDELWDVPRESATGQDLREPCATTPAPVTGRCRWPGTKRR